MTLRFNVFRREDFPLYRSWYEDAALNTHLGPMDDAWLECVLKKTDGRQHAVFDGEDLVAVVGVAFPAPGYPEHCITDLAIKPDLRSSGIGSDVLRGMLGLYGDGTRWKAFVDQRNPRGKAFFEKNGWISSDDPDRHGMYRLDYEKRPQDK